MIPVQAVNVVELNRFEDGTVVDPKLLAEAGLVRKHRVVVKILGNGELKKRLTVKVHRFSKSAQEKIAKAGGSTEAIKRVRN